MLSGLTPCSGTSTGGTADKVAATKRMHLQHDWTALRGEVIEVRKHAATVRTGRVDGVTHDGTILWIESHGAEPRAMYERCEGFTAWIDYKWESGYHAK
jgi:hypothetical protein